MSDNPDLNPAVASEPEPGRGAVPGSGPESAPELLPPPPDPGISEIGPPDEVASNRPGPTPTGRVVDAMAKWLPKFARRVHQVVLAMSWLAGLTGIGALLSLFRRQSSSGRQMCLCEVSRPIMKLFEVVEIEQVFKLYDSEKEALSAMQSE